jgi:hypothetical protein
MITRRAPSFSTEDVGVILVLQDFPQFVLVTGGIMGPLRPGDLVGLPSIQAEILVSREAARLVRPEPKSESDLEPELASIKPSHTEVAEEAGG